MVQNHAKFRDLATIPCKKKAKTGDDAVDADMGSVQALFKLEDFRSAMKKGQGIDRCACNERWLDLYHTMVLGVPHNRDAILEKRWRLPSQPLANTMV